MHQLQSTQPCTLLRPFVRAFAQRDISCSGVAPAQPVPASLEQILEFEDCTPLSVEYIDGRREASFSMALVGPHTHHRAHIRFAGCVQSFGIFFQPFGLWQLFRVPAGSLVNQTDDASHLLGSPIRDLWMQLGECRSFAGRVATVEAFLLQRLRNLSARTPIMRAAVSLFESRGVSRISEVASASGLSLRQFERRFADTVGLSPKLFARITRFQMALDAKLSTPTRSWLAIAHDFGYHDQMHMVRDFHGLAGNSPERLFAALGDTRPPALAAAPSDTSTSSLRL